MIEGKIKDYFRSRDDIATVFLFGSHATGKDRPNSDVDIAILFQSMPRELMRDLIDILMVDLSRLLKKDIHPVILNHAGEELLAQVFKKGKCIIVNDRRKLAVFRMAAFAKIFDFAYYRGVMQAGLIKSVMRG